MRARAATALCFVLTACGSPPTRVFDLSPSAAVPSAAAPVALAAARGGPLIWVDKPSVAGYFDRTQMVLRDGANRVSVHEFEVWSDPPADLISRAIVDDLARRFGADRVMATPVTRYVTPEWRVEIDVLRFDVGETGVALLDARWTLLQGRSDRLAGTHRERIDVESGDVADPARRVVALRAAVAILAERIGDAIARGR